MIMKLKRVEGLPSYMGKGWSWQARDNKNVQSMRVMRVMIMIMIVTLLKLGPILQLE